jgi:mono/diheme cytochrome c family protein
VATSGGQPIVRAAGRTAFVATAALVAASLLLATLRPRRFGRPAAASLLLLGLVSIGASEWLREGLRKPWLIDRYMFVNGVRVPPPPGAPARIQDPYALDALARHGVLAVSPWLVAPTAFRPGDPTFERLPDLEQARLAAEAGRAVFALECAVCHTERGHLGVRRLVSGKSVAAIMAMLDATARPLTRDGRPGAWAAADVRVASWRGRRMPPFAGIEAEKRALAIHLARLGGDERAGLAQPLDASAGAAAFERHCAACHGAEAAWPIAERLRARSAGELYELIGRLPELREEMPPFSGTEEERRALARHLGDLGAAGASEGVPQ